MHNSAQLIQGYRQTALLKVYLLRCAEPQHILSPLSNSLNVQQMLHAYVLRYRVAAPGAAAQCQRRSQLEVVQITDTAVRRRSINQDTAGFHCFCVLHNLFLLIYVNVQGSSMSVTAVCNQTLSLYNCLVKGLSLVHSQYRRQLLMSKFLADIYRLNLTDQNLGITRILNASQLCNLISALSYNLCIQRTIDQNGLSYLIQLFRLQEVATAVCEFFLYFIINRCQNSYRLLRSTNHTVIKGFGMNNGVYCHLNISSVVQNNRGISCAYAQRRFSGRISCLNHTRAAGCQNNICILHNCVGQLQRRYVNPSDNSLRCASLNSCIQNNLCCCNGRFFCTGMWGNNNCISCFQANQSFENSSGGRVCSRNNCCYQTDRLCNFLDSVRLIFFYHTAGFGVLVSIVNILCCIVIFNNLIFYNTHTGLGHCHLSQRDSHFVGCRCCLVENFIDLLLSKGSKNLLSLTHCLHLYFQSFYIVNDFGNCNCLLLCHCHLSSIK